MQGVGLAEQAIDLVEELHVVTVAVIDRAGGETGLPPGPLLLGQLGQFGEHLGPGSAGGRQVRDGGDPVPIGLELRGEHRRDGLTLVGVHSGRRLLVIAC